MGLVLSGFSNALVEIAKVGTCGANKYSDNGWMTVPDGQKRYCDAQLRHMMKTFGGEDTDADTGLLHLSHEAWNVLARLELKLRERKQ